MCLHIRMVYAEHPLGHLDLSVKFCCVLEHVVADLLYGIIITVEL